MNHAPRVLLVGVRYARLLELKRRLSEEGYEVRSAGTGSEAFRHALQVRPDLIVMEAVLPDGRGVENAKRWRSDPRLEGIPIVLLSDPGDGTVMSASVSDVLEGPRGADTVVRAVHYWMLTRDSAGALSLPVAG